MERPASCVSFHSIVHTLSKKYFFFSSSWNILSNTYFGFQSISTLPKSKMIVFIAIGGKAREDEFLVIKNVNVFDLIIESVLTKSAQLNILVTVQECDATDVEKCAEADYTNSLLN